MTDRTPSPDDSGRSDDHARPDDSTRPDDPNRSANVPADDSVTVAYDADEAGSGVESEVDPDPDPDSDADADADADPDSDADADADPDTAATAADDALAVTGGELRYRTTPTVRPVLGLLGTVVLVGAIAVLIPVLWPELFGDPAIAEIVLYAICVLLVVTISRLVVRLVVLWRTQYEIRENALVRRYNLAYKRTVRRIPVSKLRGHEFTQSRYQASLGVGSIRLLTAGTDRSLGFLEFEHLRDPDAVLEEIHALFAERDRFDDRD